MVQKIKNALTVTTERIFVYNIYMLYTKLRIHTNISSRSEPLQPSNFAAVLNWTHDSVGLPYYHQFNKINLIPFAPTSNIIRPENLIVTMISLQRIITFFCASLKFTIVCTPIYF